MNDESVPYEEIMDIDDSISAGTSSRTLRAACSDVFRCGNLLDAIRFILNNNTYQKNIVTLSVSQEEAFFIVIEKLRVCPKTMFKCLHDHFAEHFAEHFDIYLYIIAFDNGKFSLMNKINHDKKYTAFVTFNKDHTIRGPLYTTNVNGTTETVFSVDNRDIILDVYMHIAQLNDIKSSTGSPQIQEQQAVYGEQELGENLLTNNIPASTDQFAESVPVQVDIKTQSRIVLNQMLQQIFRIIDGLPLDPHTLCQSLQPFVSHITAFKDLSPLDAIEASKDGINHLWHLAQLADQLVSAHQNEQVNMSQPQPSSDINNQNAEIQNETNEIPLNTSLADNTADIIEIYASPTPIKSLEKTIHPRTLKEFAKTSSSPIKCVNSKQRDPVPIKVPPDDGIILHLDMQVVDSGGQTHLSKILVPHKTKAADESLMNNNDLNCLNFSKCDKTYKFDRDTKHLYSKISSQERRNLQKDIRIHMINLYQTGEITKKIIQNKDLKKCRLAFSFCTLENGKYKRVSPIYYADEIEDSIKSTNKKKKTLKKGPKRLSQRSINVH